MKTKKRTMLISFLNEEGEVESIQQNMSKQTIGTGVWYFIDQGYNVVGIEEVKENGNNSINN